MSRLNSAIRRLRAQRDCLNEAAVMVASMHGPMLEFGLGNGRTFDHLRERCPGREVFVFERKVAAHPSCIPDDAHLFEGDFRDTVPQAVGKLAGQAVLVHCDIGSGDAAETARLAEWLGPALVPLLAPGAVVISDQMLHVPGALPLPLPEGVAEGRYFMVRMPG
jgi:hypothetical protein